KAEFAGWMKRIGCKVEEVGAGILEATPPLFRWDISIDMDLVEELSRLNGYDRIPEKFPAILSEPTNDHPEQVGINRVHDVFVRLGYRQAVNYSFVSGKQEVEFLGASGANLEPKAAHV